MAIYLFKCFKTAPNQFRFRMIEIIHSNLLKTQLFDLQSINKCMLITAWLLDNILSLSAFIDSKVVYKKAEWLIE